MIKIIGKENCSACNMTKTILGNKGIEFEYILLEELYQEDKKQYIDLARKEGKMSMPLIIKDDKLMSLQEVIA